MPGTTSSIEFTQSNDKTHNRIYRGKTLRFEVVWGGNTPIDVSGYEAALQIRDLKGQLLLEVSAANSRIAAGGADGTFTVSGSPADTRLISSVGNRELELAAPNGDVYGALYGPVTSIEEVVIHDH